MKTYLVFGGEEPQGGWDDWKGSFEDLESAKVFVRAQKFGWAEVVSLIDGEKVVWTCDWRGAEEDL